MSYLDDPRVFFAAERTLLAWQRTAIALIGLGFVIERFGLFVRLTSLGGSLSSTQSTISTVFGVIFLLIGSVVALVSALNHQRFISTLGTSEIPQKHVAWMGTAANVCVSAAALALATWFAAYG